VAGADIEAEVLVEPGVLLGVTEAEAVDFDTGLGIAVGPGRDERMWFGWRIHDVAQTLDGNVGLLEFLPVADTPHALLVEFVVGLFR